MDQSPATPRPERHGDARGFFQNSVINANPFAEAFAAEIAASALHTPTPISEADMRDAQPVRANSEIQP